MIQKLSISFSIILYLFCLYTTVEGLIQNVGFKLKSDIHNYKSLKSLPANLRDCVEVLNRKKVIVVSGGVMSGIGKGVTASSVGVLAKHLGLTTTAVKIDPYLNIDAGTMSPIEHGEVFVLDDGSETDLDLGNYERFLDICLKGDSNLTTGKVYEAVISKERRGEYLGKTVQIIPHITDEIIDRIAKVSKYCVDNNSLEPEIVLIELGGTIGKRRIFLCLFMVSEHT